jgi:hypothetical protein
MFKMKIQIKFTHFFGLITFLSRESFVVKIGIKSGRSLKIVRRCVIFPTLIVEPSIIKYRLVIFGFTQCEDQTE